MTTKQGRLAPLVKTVTVPTTPERAFALFTVEMGAWWPLSTHSIGGDRARRVTVDERVGGELVEHGPDGPLGTWGTITHWDPPAFVSFTWHPGTDQDNETEVSVRFSSVTDGTLVELTHDRWDQRPDGIAMRESYDTGWDFVLGRFAEQLR